MSFMTPEITRKIEWVLYEDHEHNNCFVPLEDFSNEHGEAIETLMGYGARLSANGYMDCTNWSVFPTFKQAAQYLLDTYYDMAYDEMTGDEKAEAEALEDLAKG